MNAHLLLTMGLALLTSACNPEGKDDSGSDSGSDSNDTTETDDTAPTSRLPEAAWGLPNLDDDDANGTTDWMDAGAAPGDNERTLLTIPADLLADGTLTLSLDSGADVVRLWVDGAVVVGAAPSGTLSSWTVPAGSEDVSVEIEFQNLLSEGRLTWATAADAGATRLLAAPYIQSHHGLAAEEVWAVAVSAYGFSNGEMINELASTLGDLFTEVNGESYREDVWIQDEFDFGTVTSPTNRIDYILDSVRNRGIDKYDEAAWLVPDAVITTYGESRGASSLDYFGNLEATPPIEVDGVTYPFGRLYYGGTDSYKPEGALTDFLAAQKVQSPVALDTSWLCVGHVDEVVTFIPDPSSAEGFKVAIADTAAAWALLDSLDPSLDIPKYKSAHGYSTVGEMTSDSALRSLNDRIQADHVDPFRESMKTAFGLDDSDFIFVPGLWEEPRGCGAYVAALIPGIVNMAVAGPDPDHPYLLIADPFLRDTGAPEEDDPLIQELNTLWPATATPVYLDDWAVYHEMLGEVHCGSNTRRTPVENWWEVGLDLIGGEK